MKNNIKKYRIWTGLSQRQLAKAIGISAGEVRVIENNKHQLREKTRVKICELFGVNYDQMFYNEGEIINE